MSLPDLSHRAASTDLCRRSFDLEDIELREDDDTGDLVFTGRASVVDFPYTVRDFWGEYTETIKAGAFNKTLRDGAAAVSLYVNHRHSDVPLATRGAGTLTLNASPHLDVEARLDPVRPDVQIIASAVRRGEMRQMSIGFNPVKSRDKWNSDMTEVTRGEVALREVSIVEVGANTGGTKAKMRAFDDFLATITDVEMTDDELKRALDWFQNESVRRNLAPIQPALLVYDGTGSASSTNIDFTTYTVTTGGALADLRADIQAEEEAKALALQAELDWEMSIRRKHPATV